MSVGGTRNDAVAGGMVAIHQPNYLPWMGFFDKANKAGALVLLDSVQFAKRSWINRTRVLTANGATWLSVPVRVKGRLEQRIDATEIDDSVPWRRKHVETLRRSLQRTSGFGLIEAELLPVLLGEQTLLVDLNIALLDVLLRWLHLDVAIVRSSSIATEGASTQLLASLTKSIGGDTYLSGGGADEYQEEQIFSDMGIGLQYQEFMPSPYPQGREDFVPGLSVVDVIAHCGVEATRQMLDSERERWQSLSCHHSPAISRSAG